MFQRIKIAGSNLERHPALPYLLLGAITLLAAAMRFFSLGKWSFWIDEVYTLRDTHLALQNFSLKFPPSTYLIAGVLELLPTSEWSARLVPALIGILSLVILYFPIKRLLGSSVALLSLLFLALSPWHLLWSQSARFYTSLLLFYTLAVLVFYMGLEEDRPLFLLASFFFLGIATLERKMALFFVPIVLAYIILVELLHFGRPVGLRRRTLTGMAVPVVVFGLYEVYEVAFAGQEPFFSKFIQIFIGHQQNPLRVFLSVISDAGLPLFVLALGGAAFLLLRRSRLGLYLALGAVLPLAVIVVIAPFTQVFSRYVFQTLPTWAILGAVAVKELYTYTQRHTRVLALAIFLIVAADALSQDVLYYGYQNGNRQNWKGAFHLVLEGEQPGDQVVTTRIELGEYYTGNAVLWTQGLEPKQVIASGKRTWFVIDDRTGFVSPALENWLLTQARLVGERDVYVPGKAMAMRIYLYDPAVPLPPVP